MDAEDRIACAHGHAGVDDLLAATLHLGVAPLHRIEIQRLIVAAGAHRGGGAAPETDAQRGAAELHDQRPGHEFALVDLAAADVAHAARKHDRLVITVVFA